MTHRRWFVATFILAITAVAYIDRANLSVAAPVLIKEFHTNDAVMGLVLSSYTWTYAALMIPAGIIADRLASRILFALAMAVWSVASLATAAVSSVATLFLPRLALGIGEAPFVPTSFRVISEWLPRRERGLASSFYVAGVALGTAVAAPSLGYLISGFGWQSAFISTGVLSAVCAIGWAIWYRSVPDAKKLSEAERTLITTGREPYRPEGRAPWSAIVRHANMWALSIGFFLFTYILYTFISWLPSYLIQARHFTLLGSGIYTAVPWVCAFFAGLLGGRVSDAAHRRGAAPLKSRKIVLVTGMTAAMAVIPSAFVTSAAAAIVLLSVSTSGLLFANGAIYAAIQDISSGLRLAGSATGFANFWSNVGGILGPIVTGFLAAATHSFVIPLVVAGLCALAAAVIFTFGLRERAGSARSATAPAVSPQSGG